jgi:sortase A
MRNWESMTDSHRFLLLLLSGVLLFSGITAAVLEQTEPTSASASESPVLETGVVADPTTTTAAPPDTVPAISVPTPAPTPAETSIGGARGPVVPPKNSYAPEPIQEIGTIEIPKIGLNHKIMHGITLRNIDHGPSHWPGTPLPGQDGNTVFAGHRVTHSHPFRRIDELEPGDEIFFTVAGVRSRYVVTGHEVVSPSRVDIVNPTPEPTLTLFACHPPGSARQRYVVRAALSPVSEPAVVEEAPAEPAPEG